MEAKTMTTQTTEFKRQHSRFTDAKGNLLEIQAKQMKDGTYQVVAYHTPKNGKKQRGCVGVYDDADSALKRFAALCIEAEKAKWQRKTRQPKGGSAFDTLPKAAA
jgi:hypothetical protein